MTQASPTATKTGDNATGNKPNFSPGLAGVIAGESSICLVDPDRGLFYRGYDAGELATKSNFEEVAWLLIHDDLPTAAEYEKFKSELATESKLPGPVVQALRLMPRNMHPMDMLRTGVSMLAAFDSDLNDVSHAANVRKAVRLIARVGTLVTDGWRIQQGQEPFTPASKMDFASRFLFGLTGREPEPWRAAAINTVLILYAEHEFNASTFAARVTASSLADMYAGITSGIGTLKGPLHGGANEEAMAMLNDIKDASRAESWVKERLVRKDKIMGFGHRVYKQGDSRVPAMRNVSRDLATRFNQPGLVDTCIELEKIMDREKGLCANVDLYAAPLFHLLQIAPELNTPIFAAGRVAGWCAHVIEQHDNNRILRPRCWYNGSEPRPYHKPA